MNLLNCELILQLISCLAICGIRGQDWGQADQQGEIKATGLDWGQEVPQEGAHQDETQATGLDWNQGMSQEETRAGKQSCIVTA
jgi:hypothetical protein